jgi:hypothetical protein
VNEAEKLELLAGQHDPHSPGCGGRRDACVFLPTTHKQIMNRPYLFYMCSATF